MKSYQPLTRQTILLHWVTGLLFIGTFIAGYIVAGMERSPEKFELLAYHKSFGVIILVVASIRLLWRIKEGNLPTIGEPPAWQEKIAHAVHGILLLATIAMPISGIAMSVGGGHGIAVFGFDLIAKGEKIETLQQIGSAIHGTSVNIIIAVFALHVLGAIKHQVIDKDGTISRMLGR
ncbi:cytochrome b [Vibrio maerlii]|uniref:cytochrome b n=1 Tax=Vibrio maerlii TaxID=2231648 RepID=UPI000E3E60EA|nr:cytochrome b [Vibrio maerlii]